MSDVKDYYRHLHQIPEISGCEQETAEYIYNSLCDMGYSPNRIGKTGVYADLTADKSLPWILLRADIDALPIDEKSCATVVSRHNGVMHACGHDSHTAMLLGAALSLRGKNIEQNIRFLFQPAEETTEGAAEMIRCGIIPQNLIACFAMHVWPGVKKGTVATRTGALMASSDVYSIEIKGKSAHCAQSVLGADALQTAVLIAASLAEIRAVATDKDTILFCGSIASGNSHNIVPDKAKLSGTLRTFSETDRKNIKLMLEKTVKESAQKYGTEAQLNWYAGCPAIDNSEKIINELGGLVPDFVCDQPRTLAAEDFACYQKYAQGVMLWLGTGDTPPLHNESFFVPEDILPKGVSLWQKIALHNWTAVCGI